MHWFGDFYSTKLWTLRSCVHLATFAILRLFVFPLFLSFLIIWVMLKLEGQKTDIKLQWPNQSGERPSASNEKLGLVKCKTYRGKINSRVTEWKDMNKLQEQGDFLLLSFRNSVLVMLFHVTKHCKSQVKGVGVHKMFCSLVSVRSCQKYRNNWRVHRF